jgi:hypothetical protein
VLLDMVELMCMKFVGVRNITDISMSMLALVLIAVALTIGQLYFAPMAVSLIVSNSRGIDALCFECLATSRSFLIAAEGTSTERRSKLATSGEHPPPRPEANLNRLAASVQYAEAVSILAVRRATLSDRRNQSCE